MHWDDVLTWVTFVHCCGWRQATVASGASLDLNAITAQVASLAGPNGANVYLCGRALTVGDGTSTVFAGTIADAGGASPFAGGTLDKVDGGTLTLSGTNIFAGGVRVSAGTLRADGSRVVSCNRLTSSATGTGPVTVSGSGILAGSGGTSDVTVDAGGVISAGTGISASDSVGTLSTGVQAWNSGGGYVVKVTPAGSADQLKMSGLTINASSTPFQVSPVSTSGAVTLHQGQSILIAVDRNTSRRSSNPFASAIGTTLVLNTTGSNVSAFPGDVLALTTVPDGTGYDLYLSDIAAPEPASLFVGRGVQAAAYP